MLKNKTRTAQINEALCKVLRHHICCLIQSMYERLCLNIPFRLSAFEAGREVLRHVGRVFIDILAASAYRSRARSAPRLTSIHAPTKRRET